MVLLREREEVEKVLVERHPVEDEFIRTDPAPLELKQKLERARPKALQPTRPLDSEPDLVASFSPLTELRLEVVAGDYYCHQCVIYDETNAGAQANEKKLKGQQEQIVALPTAPPAHYSPSAATAN